MATDNSNAIYNEEDVPSYVLPDLLTTEDGRVVSDRNSWTNDRRPELLSLFQNHVYGIPPEQAINTRMERLAEDRHALEGAAVRKEIRIWFGPDANGPHLDLLVFIPTRQSQRVPAFIGLNYFGNQSVHADTGIRLSESWMRQQDACGIVDNRATEETRGVTASRWPIERIIDRGYALVTAYYGDLDPDFDDGFSNGIHPLFYEEGKARSRGNESGAIGAWAWGLSRALDYLETDSPIDHTRVAVMGHSRLGKTALWAGALDQRFAAAISNGSGCGGAALSRRRFGETVARINTNFPHWFCRNFHQYNDREDDLPIDQHMLIALMAPRPVYVASAAEDLWADPRGEFASARLADPVYRLLGAGGMDVEAMPGLETPVTGRIGYHIRPGGHDVTLYDWDRFMDFTDVHMARRGPGNDA